MYSKAIKLAIVLALCPSLLGIGLAYSLVNYLEIPDIKNLESYKPKSATRLYADDGTLFAELYVEKRVPIPITQMPQHLKSAFIAIEDVRFYDHFGVDLRGIARAAYRNITRKGITEGASTITQQLARNLYLTHKKSFKRKVEEAVLAIQIERTYSKDEILNLYLNLIYLGEGAYGVEAAAYTYFHKKASELTLPESAMLAALTKSPSRLSPYKNAKAALERRNTVLRRMYDAGFINQGAYAAAVKTTIDVVPFKAYEKKTGFFTEFVKQVVEEYVKDPQEVYTTGLNIQTTMNLKMTQDAYEAIQKGLELYRKRHPNVKELPEVAMVVMDVKTGEIKVLIGGTDFGRSPFNRAVQAKRQPGSAFKPIIYLAALEQGLTPTTVLRDGPISFTNPYTRQVWSPKNYKNEYHGNVTMSKALALSLNTATVRLVERVGVDNVIELAKRLHISGRFEPNLSLALGTTEISPLDLASAYAVFARGGTYMPPTAVKAVATTDGESLFNEDPQEERLVSPEHTAMLVEMLRGVVQSGTARSASHLPFPLAGKTGTTDDFKDAWFIGFSPDLLCLVWTGYDKHNLLGKGESGATASLPIWIEFMSRTLPDYPAGSFPSEGQSTGKVQ
jgi:penicillin-binding protein 1A